MKYNKQAFIGRTAVKAAVAAFVLSWILIGKKKKKKKKKKQRRS